MGSILFAEYFGHVHTINLTLQPDTDTDGPPAKLLQEGDFIRLEGGICSIELPATPVPGSKLDYNLSSATGLSRTWRMKTVPPVSALSSTPDQEDAAPWSSKDLPSGSELRCAATRGPSEGCDAVIVPNDRILQCKDLPSETWAEMMELWHCHKPDEPHSHDTGSQSKGYSAASKLSVQTGTLLIDTLTFLLSQTDCTNIEVSPPYIHRQHYSTRGSRRSAFVGHVPSLDSASIQIPNIHGRRCPAR